MATFPLCPAGSQMTPAAPSRRLTTTWWVKECMAGLPERAMGVFITFPASTPQKITLGKRRFGAAF